MNKATLQYKEHNFHGVYGVLKLWLCFYGVVLWSSKICDCVLRNIMEFLEFTNFTEHNFHGVYGVLKLWLCFYGVVLWSSKICDCVLRNIMEFLEFTNFTEHNFHGVYGVLKLWLCTTEHHGVLGVLCSSKMCFFYGFKVMWINFHGVRCCTLCGEVFFLRLKVK